MMSRPAILKPQSLRDLTEIDGADGWWQVNGPAASFRLAPEPGGLPKGWTRLVLRVEAPRNAFVPLGFRADCGRGYQPLRPVLPARLPDGSWTVLVHVPPDTIALAMSPPVSQGPFRIGSLTATPLARSLVGIRLALSFGRRWLREPRQFLGFVHDTASALRGRRWGEVRSAIGRSMLDDSPAAADAPISSTARYQRWIDEHERSAPPASAPPRSVSVLILAGHGDAERLRTTLASLHAQADVAWECRIGFRPGGTGAAAALPQGVQSRVIARTLTTPERGGMLAALATGATGDLLLVLDPGDRLAPEALAILAAVPEADIIHGDEDRIREGGRRSKPYLKPEWSPELLEAFNYFGRPTALLRTLVERAGGFTAGFGAGTEWDLHLRLTSAGARVRRVPGILCHRPAETLADRPPPRRPEATEHRAAIAAHWHRQGIIAEVTTQPDGTQRAIWEIAEAPLVSVIILDRGRPAQLNECLCDLLQGTDYPRIQIVIVGNGPPDPASLAPSDRVETDDRIRHVLFEAPCNDAAARNAGARAATGRLLLFLDDGVVVIERGWLMELVRFAMRPGIGVVGTLLVSPQGGVQHAGITIGLRLCDTLFRGAPEAEWGPIGSPLLPRSLSAVGGACQMVRAEVFTRVGGFDETYVRAHGDVALCLAARAAGWRTAYTPYARLSHQGGMGSDGCAPDAELTRIASDIRRFGYRQDPFFHPALDADSTIPRLRVGTEPGNASSLARNLQRHTGTLPRPVPLDLYCDDDVAEAVGMPVAALFWPPILPDAIDDRWSAARWCLDLLRRRPDLRERFPGALSNGNRGAFARWVAGEAGQALGLHAEAVAQIQAALAAGLSARARQVVLVDTTFSSDLAFAFLPHGRAALLSYLFRRDDSSLRREEIWWLALECAEDPARELLLSYRFNAGWQALFPDGLTIFSRDRMAKWFRTSLRTDAAWTDPARWPETLTAVQQIRLGWNSHDHWQRRHPAPFVSPAAARALLAWLAQPGARLAEPAQLWLAAQPVAALAEALVVPGVNVIGHFCYPSGLRTSILAVVQGLSAEGLDLSLRDVPVDAEHDLPAHAEFAGLELHDTTLLHIQPEPFFTQAFTRSGLRPRRRRTHRIGYWYWELDSVPASWAKAVTELDEIWAATSFVGDALRSRFDVPIYDLMPGVELPAFTKRSREHFGIPPHHFAFLFAFHLTSIMERKNPLGLVRAFRRAFSPYEPVTLVLKTSFGDKHPAELAQLHAAAEEAGGRIMIIDRVFTTDETISLMEACDAYVSLHRSEGFGLTMAEAMLLAKPVIATRYSGNLDFMTSDNSLLVDYRLISNDKPIPPYEIGTRWADPSEEHAASLMRRVRDDPDFAAALGAQAKADASTRLSVAAAGQRMAARLEAIESRHEQCAPAETTPWTG